MNDGPTPTNMDKLAALAPLDTAIGGHLVVRPGLGSVTVGSNASPDELYSARCLGRAPVARRGGGAVERSDPRLSVRTNAHSDTLTLNRSTRGERHAVTTTEIGRAALADRHVMFAARAWLTGFGVTGESSPAPDAAEHLPLYAPWS